MSDDSNVIAIQVLMQTGDAELEMRGRCSAGQKVKFCLVYSKHRW